MENGLMIKGSWVEDGITINPTTGISFDVPEIKAYLIVDGRIDQTLLIDEILNLVLKDDETIVKAANAVQALVLWGLYYRSAYPSFGEASLRRIFSVEDLNPHMSYDTYLVSSFNAMRIFAHHYGYIPPGFRCIDTYSDVLDAFEIGDLSANGFIDLKLAIEFAVKTFCPRIDVDFSEKNIEVLSELWEWLTEDNKRQAAYNSRFPEHFERHGNVRNQQPINDACEDLHLVFGELGKIYHVVWD